MSAAITDEILARLADDPLLELRMAVIKVSARATAAQARTAEERDEHGLTYAQLADNWLGGPVGEFAGLWTPEAAFEVAGWLESVVKRLERQQPGAEGRGEGPVALADKAAAFTIARALLGRTP
ncbi:hypothetical protein ACPPVO_22420 [Dactylosporangium sp. McL0621]|uniref:hypothetical protein n=1 Tax=Dactylosporangium sp. McL0621 TaxID=3415678 RepID=UPI003CEF5E16